MVTHFNNPVTGDPSREHKSHWIEPFLACLRLTGNWAAASRACKIGRSTPHVQCYRDPEFKRRCHEALADFADDVESEAIRRAMGYESPVIYQGQECGRWVNLEGKPCDPQDEGAQWVPLVVTKYSDSLMVTVLKALLPWKYDRQAVIPDVPPGGPLSTQDDGPLTVDGTPAEQHQLDPAALVAYREALVRAGLWGKQLEKREAELRQQGVLPPADATNHPPAEGEDVAPGY